MKKNFTLTIFFAAALIGFSMTSNAQDTGTATSSATVVTPISITKTTDMNFGNVAVTSTAGTVILAPAGTRTKTGGVTLPTTSGTVAAAVFKVDGDSNYTYTITLPSSHTIKHPTNTAASMIVDNFTSDPSGTGALTSGTQNVKVGATLNVSAQQAAGTYTNTTGFDVTVNYN